VVSASTAGWRRPWRGLAIASAVTALAACTSPTFTAPPDPAPAPPAPASETQVPDTPAPPPADADASPAARAARLAGRPPPPADTGRESQVRLIGLSREFVLELLGPAGFIRRDGPVQIWRYTGDECFLDVFLFREGDAFRVNHVEARSKNADQISVSTCYQRLVAARRAAGAG
jgi:hypothetical protein